MGHPKGRGRELIWFDLGGGMKKKLNQQYSSNVYHKYPIGWLNFPQPGKYKLQVNCVEGDRMKAANLKAIHFKRVKL